METAKLQCETKSYGSVGEGHAIMNEERVGLMEQIKEMRESRGGTTCVEDEGGGDLQHLNAKLNKKPFQNNLQAQQTGERAKAAATFKRNARGMRGNTFL